MASEYHWLPGSVALNSKPGTPRLSRSLMTITEWLLLLPILWEITDAVSIIRNVTEICHLASLSDAYNITSCLAIRCP